MARAAHDWSSSRRALHAFGSSEALEKGRQVIARHGKAKDLTDSHLRQSRSSWKSRTTGAAECVDQRKSCFTFLMPRSQLNSAS